MRSFGTAVLLVVLTVLAGCGSPPPSPQSESATDRLGAVSRVEIDADVGSVSLRPGPEGSAQVQRTLRDVVVYSIIEPEWPGVRRGLEARLRWRAN